MNNVMKISPIICFLILLGFGCIKSAVIDTSYKVIIEAGTGFGISTDTLTKAGSRYGLSGMLRILWKPDHLLKCGVETGWLHIASNEKEIIKNEFGESEIDASIKAIPLMLVFDMNIRGFDLYTGLGYYYVTSYVSAFGESLRNSSWNVGFYLSLAHKYPVFEDAALGWELKWHSIGELGKTLLSASVYLSYNLYEW